MRPCCSHSHLCSCQGPRLGGQEASIHSPGPQEAPRAGRDCSPWGEEDAVRDTVWLCKRSSAVWFFLGLRSGFAVFIFLGRPRFRPAIFRPFLFNFFFRALEGDGFLTVVTPAFSSSAPESWGAKRRGNGRNAGSR